MRIRHIAILAGSLFLGIPAVGALADYVYTDANGTHTVFSFVCQTTKLCTGFVLMDSTGTEKATSGNPVRIDPVGTTTQPVTCVSGCIGGGGANAAASNTGSGVPAAADYLGLNIGGNLTGQTGRSVSTTRAADVALNDNSGNQIGIAAAPLRTDPVGTTTQPVSATSWPLPTGGATSANQATNSATTTHTCSTSGFSELGCLGQIDDDVKAALPAGTNVIGFNSADPCTQATKLGAPINLTASGQVIAGTSAKKTYICSLDIISATAQNIALVEGTGTTCATNIFGLAGGITAATGWNLAANGGLSKGSGAGTVYSPSADANAAAANVCLLLSGSGQTSGQLTYVQQ